MLLWRPGTQKPDEPKGLMSAYRNGCNDFNKLVDDNYAKVEEYFNKE